MDGLLLFIVFVITQPRMLVERIHYKPTAIANRLNNKRDFLLNGILFSLKIVIE